MSIFFSFLSVLPAFHTIFIGIDVFVLNSLASFTLLPRPGLVATPSRYREPTTPSRAKTAAQRLALPLHVLQPRPTVQRCRGSIGNSDFFIFFFRWIVGGLCVSLRRPPLTNCWFVRAAAHLRPREVLGRTPALSVHDKRWQKTACLLKRSAVFAASLHSHVEF